MADKKQYKSRDLYEEATNKIIEGFEKAGEWDRPWKKMEIGGMPRNGFTNAPYSGVNPLILMIEGQRLGYTDSRWATFKQAEERGIKLKPDSRGTGVTIYFTKRLEVEDKDPTTGEVRLNPDGSAKTKTIPMLKSFTVFNAQQFENFPLPPGVEAPTNDWSPVEHAENIANSLGVRIDHGGDRAFYAPGQDRIQMPPRESFSSPEAYYAVLLHEGAHSTGHPSRLNRDLSGGFGSEKYAEEELRADIASFFITSELGLSNEENFQRHAAYVKNWIGALKNDKKLIFRAARDSAAIADWVMNRERTPALEKPAATPAAVPEPALEAGLGVPEPVTATEKQAAPGNDTGRDAVPAPVARQPASALDLAVSGKSSEEAPENREAAQERAEPFTNSEAVGPQPVREEAAPEPERLQPTARMPAWDNKRPAGTARRAGHKEDWTDEPDWLNSLHNQPKLGDMSTDPLTHGAAEAMLIPQIHGLVRGFFTGFPGAWSMPQSVMEPLFNADLSSGVVRTVDMSRFGKQLEKQGLVFADGRLTTDGIATAKGLHDYAEKLETGMPMSAYEPGPAPNPSPSQQRAAWGDKVMTGKVGDKAAWSNGAVLFVRHEATGTPMPTHTPAKDNAVDMNRVWHAQTGEAVVPVAVSGKLGDVTREIAGGKTKTEFAHHKVIWFESGQAVDAKYYDATLRAFGADNITWRKHHTGDNNQPLEVYVGEERVGLVMGMRNAHAFMPEGVAAIIEEHKTMRDMKPQTMWHIERAGEMMQLVSPAGEKRDIPDFKSLQRTVSTIAAYDSQVLGIRGVIEEQYWVNLPAEHYAQEADRQLKERYGVSLRDAEPPGYATNAQATGMHPAEMVESLAAKYKLEPIADVMQPYGNVPRQSAPALVRPVSAPAPAPMQPASRTQREELPETNVPIQAAASGVQSLSVAPSPIQTTPNVPSTPSFDSSPGF